MIESLTQFLRTTLYATASNLQPLGAGMFSQAYRFNVDDALLVVRIGVNQEAFEKDQFGYERFGRTVCVPRVLAIGTYADNRYYCISEWKTGRRLTDLDKAETERLLPSLFENLFAISRVPVRAGVDYGIITGAGTNRKSYSS